MKRWDVPVAAAAVLVDVFLFSTLLAGRAGPGDAPPALILGYAVLGGAALCWRRRAPLIVYGVVWAHALGAALVPGYRPTLLLLLALYTVAAARGLRTALTALLAAAVLAGLFAAHQGGLAAPEEQLPTAIGVGVFLTLLDCAVWTVGRAVRAGRERARDLERRRLAAAREAVAGERARIARELHDIVAHTVTLMSLHAAGASRVLRRDPDRAERALGDVGELGTQAMAELRRMLTVLREADSPTPAAGGLDELDELLAGARRAGVQVTLDSDGPAGRLDPSVATAAYRVVQESVTNLAKHAGPGTRASVKLRWTGDALTVEVVDDGSASPPSPAAARLSTGHGLLGLRERVAVVGGDLTAGPVDGGGFRVTARLPVSGAGPRSGADLVEVGSGDGRPDPARR